ncbi:NAD(P)/FAD-dependent oxidoreductase [Nonomuraea sp. NPDC050643]|uniref:flavin monoamine oxidase family protein n=1 Tax=Nonomuraea sp. NPDC050643 TaxID=3155660 RepID=UPI00340552F3
MTSEQVDVVVVGGGVAGLAAACELRGRRVVVLEAAERIGGRVRTGERDGVPYHLGAQYLAGATSARLFEQLGVERVSLPKDNGLFLRGRVRRGTATSLMRALRVGAGGLADIAAVDRDSAHVSHLVTSLASPSVAPDDLPAEAALLDERSFAEAIAQRRPQVRAFYSTLIRSLACKDPADLSALYAYAMLGSEKKEGIGGAFRARHGMRDVLEAFTRALDGRIRLQVQVTGIETRSSGIEVVYRQGNENHRLRARACVVAVPAPEVLRIVAALPAARREALARVRYGRFLAVALFLRKPIWEGGWAISCDLPVVSTLLNPAVLTGSGVAHVLSSYASEDGCREVWDLGDTQVVERFTADIAHVFPQLPEALCGAHVHRWDPGYPAWEPGHLALLSELAAPLGNIVFCGDYLSIPSVEGAIVSGLRAASQIKAARST